VYVFEVCEPHEEDDAKEEEVKNFAARVSKFVSVGWWAREAITSYERACSKRASEYMIGYPLEESQSRG
jgi:hypothetical protein